MTSIRVLACAAVALIALAAPAAAFNPTVCTPGEADLTHQPTVGVGDHLYWCWDEASDESSTVVTASGARGLSFRVSCTSAPCSAEIEECLDAACTLVQTVYMIDGDSALTSTMEDTSVRPGVDLWAARFWYRCQGVSGEGVCAVSGIP